MTKIKYFSQFDCYFKGDPIETIIEEVFRKTSYDRKRIRACVTQMWDHGLKYDDIDAVIEQLAIQVNKFHYLISKNI